MKDSLAFKYFFTHKSGRKVIAQSDAEFYTMQMSNSKKGYKYGNVPEYVANFEPHPWGGYQRLGYREWRNNPGSVQSNNEKRSREFWERCVGYEKLGNNISGKSRDSMLILGYFGCPLRSFLRDMTNHAIMMGDMDAYKRARELQPRGNMLCLPPAK